MQSHYEVNVSLNGSHFFATHPRSCVNREDVKRVYAALKERFPESLGFRVTATYAECIQYGVDPINDFDIVKDEDLD